MELNGNKKKGGRKPKPYPDNWTHVYHEWQLGDLSASEASRILELCTGTFYNMVNRYELQNGIVGKRYKSARKNKYKGRRRVVSIKGKYALIARKYNDYIERNILPRIDYQKLQDSYHTEDMEYAKGIFNLLHQAMVKIYGSEKIAVPANSVYSSSELILIPGVVSGNGEVCLALLVIDLAGAVRNVDFLTEFGCCTEDANEDMLPEEKKRLKEVPQRYTPYIYGYAVNLPEDNFNMNRLPDKVQELLSDFKDFKARLLCESNY